MTNIFADLIKGLAWLGKEIVAVPTMLSKWLTLTDDVKADAETILPELVTLIDDVDAVCVAAVKDSGAAITDAEVLVAAIAAAVASGYVNIIEDEAVIAAFNTFISQVTTTANFADVFVALKALVAQYDVIGSSVKAAIVKLEADVK